jgi:hypothetical protein
MASQLLYQELINLARQSKKGVVPDALVIWRIGQMLYTGKNSNHNYSKEGGKYDQQHKQYGELRKSDANPVNAAAPRRSVH